MSYSCIRGDIAQPMPLTLSANSVPVVIDNAATVELRWTKPDGTTTVVPLVVIDLALGEVQRIWVAGDTDVVGVHTGQILMTVAGVVETFPNDGSLVIWWVYPQVGDVCP